MRENVVDDCSVQVMHHALCCVLFVARSYAPRVGARCYKSGARRYLDKRQKTGHGLPPRQLPPSNSDQLHV